MQARLERIKVLLKQSPHDDFLRFALAKELEKLGQHKEAIGLLTSLLKDNPQYIGAYYHLGALLVGCEDVNGALNIYDKGIEIAAKLADQHAMSELKNAKMNLKMDLI
ncbi:MAG: tetratricopeptide repeat protein [Bacteroidetes bacterium]|nr:tetratricopeptide repeat protein [Bacteroidota bacterium]